jgi:hypothetical protein
LAIVITCEPRSVATVFSTSDAPTEYPSFVATPTISAGFVHEHGVRDATTAWPGQSVDSMRCMGSGFAHVIVPDTFPDVGSELGAAGFAAGAGGAL